MKKVLLLMVAVMLVVGLMAGPALAAWDSKVTGEATWTWDGNNTNYVQLSAMKNADRTQGTIYWTQWRNGVLSHDIVADVYFLDVEGDTAYIKATDQNGKSIGAIIRDKGEPGFYDEGTIRYGNLDDDWGLNANHKYGNFQVH